MAKGPPPPPPRVVHDGTHEDPSKGGSATAKPSYVKSAAATVVKRPLAQHTPELTSMVSSLPSLLQSDVFLLLIRIKQMLKFFMDLGLQTC